MREFIAYKSDRKKEKQDAERQSHRNILLNDGIEPEQLIAKLDESEHKKKKQDRAGKGRIYKKAPVSH
ncbi:hypothetical protein AB4169_06755 [Vibrio lentus]